MCVRCSRRARDGWAPSARQRARQRAGQVVSHSHLLCPPFPISLPNSQPPVPPSLSFLFLTRFCAGPNADLDPPASSHAARIHGHAAQIQAHYTHPIPPRAPAATHNVRDAVHQLADTGLPGSCRRPLQRGGRPPHRPGWAETVEGVERRAGCPGERRLVEELVWHRIWDLIIKLREPITSLPKFRAASLSSHDSEDLALPVQIPSSNALANSMA